MDGKSMEDDEGGASIFPNWSRHMKIDRLKVCMFSRFFLHECVLLSSSGMSPPPAPAPAPHLTLTLTLTSGPMQASTAAQHSAQTCMLHRPAL